MSLSWLELAVKKFSFDIFQASAALVEMFAFTDAKDNW